MEESDKIKRKLNIRRIILFSFFILIVIALIVCISLYFAKEDFRKWIDTNVLRKEVTTDDIVSIDLDTMKKSQIFAYSKYIAILDTKMLKLYDNSGENISNVDIDINIGICDCANKYLAIAEENGNNFCLLLDKNYMWSNSVEGDITQIHVNENGFVVVVTTDATSKAILNVYDSLGTLLFKSYFSSTRVIDISISKDNKYIAVGEADIAGSLIQSNVKIISVEDAKVGKEDAIISTYKAIEGELLTRIKYQDNGEISCMYSNSIALLKKDENNVILSIKDKSNITFLSNNLSNSISYLEEINTSLFSNDTIIHIVDTNSLQEYSYKIEEVAKDFYSNGNTIAINVGTDVYFFNNKGWLVKKYYSTQEISNLVFSNQIAGVIYKDRIEIVNL